MRDSRRRDETPTADHGYHSDVDSEKSGIEEDDDDHNNIQVERVEKPANDALNSPSPPSSKEGPSRPARLRAGAPPVKTTTTPQPLVGWRDLPQKGQLAVLTLARLSEPLVQTSLQVSHHRRQRNLGVRVQMLTEDSRTCSIS